MLSNETEIFQHLSFCKTHHSTQTVYFFFLLKASKRRSNYSAEKCSSGFYGSMLVMQKFKVELRHRDAS